MAVRRWAKSRWPVTGGSTRRWGIPSLENLQGLTTLKIYQADGFQQEEMNRQAEKFRKITMKVLTMRLNSITIMDLIAYGGRPGDDPLCDPVPERAGDLGRVPADHCTGGGFLPADAAGVPYFHIAMNGMAASEKNFPAVGPAGGTHAGGGCPPRGAPPMSGPPFFLPGGSGGAPWHQPGHSCGELHGHRGGIWLWKIYCGLDPDGGGTGGTMVP